MDSDEKHDDFEAISTRNLKKISQKLGKEGYKDGVFDGRASQFQRDFDVAYADGFRNGYLLGKTKGLRRDTNEADLILNKSARGQCVVCVDQGLMEKPLDVIRKCQETHMQKVEQTLQQRYNPPAEQ